MISSIRVFLALGAVAWASADQASPIEKVLEMISGLQQKVIAEGKDGQSEYDSYAEWCEDKARNLDFEIKTGKADVAESKATIEEENSSIGALGAKIEELSADIQSDQGDLKAATAIRKREASDFAAEQDELTSVISMLERATSILSKQGGAAFLQMKNTQTITDALGVMVQSSGLSSADASRLTALVQTSQDSKDADSDSDMGAPAAAVYEGQSGGIVGVLEGLTEKADSQLAKARKAEATSVANYEMLKQSLTDSVKFAESDMDKAKKALAGSQEKKAGAAGALEASSKDLAEDIKTKSTLHQDCMTAAEEFELATKSRGEELGALATAKKVITEATGGAASQSYSFIQMSSKADLSKFEAVRFVRDLSRKTKSTALAQLASRMSSAMKLGSAVGADPFAKVKGLITDMLATLEDEAASEASHKAYCDKELAAATAKKEDLTAESNALSTKIAQATSGSAKLKEQVAALQNELAGMAKARASAQQLRTSEKATYEKNSAEMSQGVDGIRMALKVLKEYYAKGDSTASDGAGSSIIGLLEVCESDFTKGLAEMTAEEESAAASYEQFAKEDQVATVTKEQDVKYKTKEAAGLDKSVSELSGDHSSATDELDAVNSGLDKLNDMCVAKAEPYAERKARREAELAGLKEALEILEGSASLLQKSTKHTLRGVRSHSA